MDVFVVDTHALVWFITQSSRLSQKAREVLRKAEMFEVEVLVPTVVLAELLYLSERKKVAAAVEDILKMVELGGGFAVVPFDYSTFKEMQKLSSELEIHDRVIIATGLVYKAKIISKDEAIKNSEAIETVW